MEKRDYRLYFLNQACCESNSLLSYLQDCPALEIHFISPYQLTTALGPVYWQGQKKILERGFPLKKIKFWLTYFETPGLALGGLRLGARHIIYKGQAEHLQKIKNLGNFYQALVISSSQEI